jgi:hypothetical protein
MSEDNKFPLGKSAFLILKPNAKSLVLLDSKEQVLDARFLLLNETVCSGHTIDIQVFSVLVGERISSDSIDHGIRLLNSDKGEVYSLGKPTVVLKRLISPLCIEALLKLFLLQHLYLMFLLQPYQ